MLKRLLQTLLVVALVYSGVNIWQRLVKPPEDPLRVLADAPLRELFGPGVDYDRPLRFDVERGAELRNLRVPNTSGLLESDGEGGLRPVLGLSARRVRITHDPLALAAGRYRPLTVEIEGVEVHTRETESGIAADFPLHIDSSEGDDGAVPRISVRDLIMRYRALADSERLRPNATVAMHVDAVDIAPDADGRLVVGGSMRALGLGQDDTAIVLKGSIEEDGNDFELEARWDPLELTDELLAVLPEDLATKLRSSGIRSGTFVLRLDRKGGEAEGEIDPRIEWNSEVDVSVADLTAMDAIDASTRQQLKRLFGTGALQVELGGGKLNIKSLVTELAGGRVQATGWVVEETGEFEIDFDIRDLRLEDEVVRNALGEGATLYDEFDPSGVVDAIGRVTRSADGTVTWSVDVLLQNADLAYVGDVGPDGRRLGFPYRVREATGRLRIDDSGVTFDDIVGFNRGAEIVIRGHAGRSWTGGETGRVRFTEDGAAVALTVVATNVPVDDELYAAIRASEFAEILDEFKIEGVIDRIELDFIKDPKIERSVAAELRLTLEGEQFTYLPFPMPLEDVRGQLTMHQPLLEGGKDRGQIYAFDVTGWAEGAPIHAYATIAEHESQGRLHVEAEGIPLAGRLADTVQTSVLSAEDLAEIWRWLEPRGKADVHIEIPLGDDPGRLKLDALFKNASIRLDAESAAPLEIANLDGPLLLRDGVITLNAMKGTIEGAPVAIEGRLEGGVGGVWDLHGHIAELRLTPSLMRSLEALLGESSFLPGGMEFESGSSMTLDLRIKKAGGEEASPAIAFEATKLDTALSLPDGTSLTLKGAQLASKDGVVTVRNLRAEGVGVSAEVRHARIEPDGETTLTGRFHAAFEDFTVPAGLLDLLPDDAAEMIQEWTTERTLRSKSLLIDVPENGPITIEGDLALVPREGAAPDEGAHGAFELMPLVIRKHPESGVVLTGLIQLGGFSVDVGVGLVDLRGAIEVEHLRVGGDTTEGRARIVDVSGLIADLTVAELSAPVDWTDGLLKIRPIRGLLCEGEMEGEFVMHTSEPIAYTGQARVKDFSVDRLRDDLAPTGPQYEGVGTATITFQNRGGSLRDLTAAGTLTIRKGRLGDLPFVANIFTLTDELAGVDERPQFERADLTFTLQEELFTFRRFDLAGPLFELPGTGTLDLTGMIDLRFTPDLVKGLLVPGIMQMPGVGPLLRGIIPEQLIYAVRVRGDLASAKPEIVFMPSLGMDRSREFEGAGPRALPRRRLPGLFR